MKTLMLHSQLEGDLATAFDRAASESLTSRAAFARRLLAEALRNAGYLPPLPSPQHTGRAREAAR